MANEAVDWQAMLARPPEQAVPGALPGRWWVAHTRPRNEKSLAQELETLRVPCYLPLRRHVTVSRTTGRRSRSIVPVFTGYLFFNATEEQRVRALMTNRVVTLLEPPSEQELVTELRQIQRVLAEDVEFECGPAVDVGDWVRVMVGPLAGVEGVVLERRSRLRVVLNVRMLAQSVSVEVAREDVEPIDAPSFPVDGGNALQGPPGVFR